MRPRAALDLREIGLADGAPDLLLEQADDLELGELAVEAAERALDLAEVAEFFAEPHITICNIYITDCDRLSRGVRTDARLGDGPLGALENRRQARLSTRRLRLGQASQPPLFGDGPLGALENLELEAVKQNEGTRLPAR